MIHVSTDYVFRGDAQKAYLTSDKPDPQNEYGRSKALGEVLVAESGADYSIVRTAWLYGCGGSCFPKKIAETLQSKGIARVVNDQIGQPTWAKDLSELILACSELENLPRIVHGTASGLATWAELASEVAVFLGLNPAEVIVPISSSDLPTPAIRPKWSVLDNSTNGLIPIGDWRERWRIAAPKVLATL